ncbi:hypothetical protein BDV93DRAFT_513487 [Ceratobasidium sp. AG-I]|nr:hypothetical protein BDV93DRAFT_513487 [Ceratobasidium sp. AG-I]
MSDAEAQHPKRSRVKTAAIATHDKAVEKSVKARDVIARNKKVREEMDVLENLEAQEEEEAAAAAAATFKKKGKAKADPQPTKKSSSSSAGSKPKASSQKDKAVSEEEANIAEVLREERQRNKLIQLISIRDDIPVNELETQDFDELDKAWRRGDGSNPAPETAPATKAPAKPTAKVAAKTPAKKVKSDLPKVSQITWMGSPLEALKTAKAQSERSNMPSPLAKSHKRKPSKEPSGAAKRPRTEETGRSSKATAALKPKTLASKSIVRNEKRAAPSRSVSASGSLAATERSGSPEDIDIDEALDNVSDGEEALEHIKPSKTARMRLLYISKASFDKKGRPKTGKYEGVERQIHDQALLETVLILTQRGMIPDAADYELYLEEGWDNAVQRRRQKLEAWPMAKHHEVCLKQRINSWRARCHTRIALGIAAAYNLVPSAKNTLEAIKAHAIDIAAKKFHRDVGILYIWGHTPDAPGAGNYRAPFLAQAIYFMFFVGIAPVGLRFKQEFNAIPLPAIAYVAGLVEYYIKCFQNTGEFDKPERLSMSDILPDVEKHERNLLKMQKLASTVFEDTQEELAATAMAFSSKAARHRVPKKKVPGVLSDDEFDVEELTPEQLAERRRARRGSLALIKLPPAADSSSDSELDNMDIDDPEDDCPSTPKAKDSGTSDDSDVDDEGQESLPGDAVVQTARGKDGRPFVPLEDYDEEMTEVPAAAKGAGDREPGWAGGFAKGTAGGFAKGTSGGKGAVEGGGDLGGRRGRDYEYKNESKGDDEEGNEDPPAGTGVSGIAQQVHNQEGSDLTELSVGEGETATDVLSKDTGEQPPAAATAASQGSGSGVGDRAAPVGADRAASRAGARLALVEAWMEARVAAKAKAAKEAAEAAEAEAEAEAAEEAAAEAEAAKEAAKEAAAKRMAAAIDELAAASDARKKKATVEDKAGAKASKGTARKTRSKKAGAKEGVEEVVEASTAVQDEGNEQAEEAQDLGRANRRKKRGVVQA